MPINTSFFHKKLIPWYLQNKRDLPWRKTSNPYFIWLSEIILQQTRVVQGLPYYEKFIFAFPSVEALAEASEDEILKVWQGLGYYSRARNLHFTAKYIANELDGIFPDTYQSLLQLKGVGDYTASAISSICYNQNCAVVDGNVYRVLSRVFGISIAINSPQALKEFKQLAQQLIDPLHPGRFNQAIMEFGARYCVPRNPDCGNCIFNDKCYAFSENKVSELPVKMEKIKIKKRFFNYIVILTEGKRTFLQQRTKKGIWQQLYEFPLIETDKEIDVDELQLIPEYRKLSATWNIQALFLYNERTVIHKLSHQELYTRFWIADALDVSPITVDIMEIGIPIEKVHNYAVPVLIENFISDFSVFKD